MRFHTNYARPDALKGPRREPYHKNDEFMTTHQALFSSLKEFFIPLSRPIYLCSLPNIKARTDSTFFHYVKNTDW
jgi:hypothetical protein